MDTELSTQVCLIFRQANAVTGQTERPIYFRRKTGEQTF